MRAWAESAGGRHEHARTVLRPVLDDTTPALLPTPESTPGCWKPPSR
jgi:hypothetical protein